MAEGREPKKSVRRGPGASGFFTGISERLGLPSRHGDDHAPAVVHPGPASKCAVEKIGQPTRDGTWACLITHPTSARSLLILISSTPAVLVLEIRRLLADIG